MTLQRYWEDRYDRGDGSAMVDHIDETRAAIWDLLDTVYDPRLTVLDLGCGDRQFWSGRTQPDEYLGVDFAASKLRPLPHPNRNIGILKADLTDPDLKLGEWDLVLMVAVLFHLPKPIPVFQRALAASRRHLLFTAHLSPIPNRSRERRHIWYTPMPVCPQGWEAVDTRALPDPRVGVSLWRRV